MKKRILAALLALSFAASLCACGKTVKDHEGTTPAETTAAPAETTPEETTAEPVPEIPELGYEHVVIIGVDGAGAFFQNTETPNMDRIFAGGATTYQCVTASPTISAQCWSSMLLGVTPEIHGLTNDSTDRNQRFSTNRLPSIFRIVRQAMPDAKLGAFTGLSLITFGIIESDLGVTVGNGGDSNIAKTAANFFTENLPPLMFVQFNSVDSAGHEHDFGSKEHLEQITYVDGLVGKLYDAVVDAGVLDTTLVVVTADHGGVGNHHGDETPQEKLVFMGAVGGKAVIPGSEIQDAETRDIAAIALTALGLPLDANMSSRVPSGLFEGITAGERHVSEMPRDVTAHREHETIPTPDPAQLQALAGDHEILAYLPMDGDASVALGGASSSTEGKFYYLNSYYDKGVRTEDGCISLSDLTVGNESFTLSLWLKMDHITGSPTIVGNQNTQNERNPGFSLRVGDDGLLSFYAANANGTARMYAAHDASAENGWMHVMVTVDREAKKATLYTDFAVRCEATLVMLKDGVLDNDFTINIGRDGTGVNKDHLSAAVDELLLLKGVLSDEEISAFRRYYGTAEIVLTEK